MCICSDTLWIADDLPTVVETVRGSISFDVSIETAAGDVHSGICGGVARNPLNELVHLGTQIAGANGELLIPGCQTTPFKTGEQFLSDVFHRVSGESFKQDFSLKSLRSEDPAVILQRSWAQPCVEICGFSGGWSGDGVKNAIPPKASLKFNVRIVPPQSVEEVETAVRTFVAEKLGCQGPAADDTAVTDGRGAIVTVTAHGRMSPFDGRLTDTQRHALRLAYRLGFNTQAAFGCVGGSIGVLNTLQSQLAPTLLPSLSSPSQGYHGKNENYNWKRFEDGVVMYAGLLNLLVEEQRKAEPHA